ncbi:tRNA pseudouridine(55) synthase TruB [Myroides sp. LJL116]
MTQFTKEAFENGQVLLIDKPLNWSSFQVVNKVKWLIKKQYNLKKIKVGHAGTLDPLATGLLLICTGKMTKSISELQGQQKQYTGSIFIGATTPSYDLETQIDQTFETQHITQENIEQVRLSYIGDIQQVPPIFSALKKDGKRLYEHARKGEQVEIQSRLINIADLEFTKIDLPTIDFKVDCSKGTYIRSLAFDIGKSLQSGAHLTALRRTKIGLYDVDNAWNIEDFEKEILQSTPLQE